MKKNYLTLTCTLFVAALFAQPQLTSNDCFQVNDSSKLGFAIVSQNYDDFISQTGNNYTWDFTTTGTPGPWTSWTNPTTAYKFQAGSQSTHTTFSLSTINEYALTAFARDLFYTYSPNNDTLYLDGIYVSNNYKYAPHIPYLTFPLSFDDSVYTHTNQYGIPTQPTNKTGSVSRYHIYDGFGTLKLPYGNVSNVYRVRTKQIDSSTVLNAVLATYEEIIWLRQSDGIPVLRFLKNGTLISAYYASATIASGVEESVLNNEINVYPNPFNDKLSINTITTEAISSVNVYNNVGQIVISTKGDVKEINTTNLSSGSYFIELLLKDKTPVRKKIVKY